MATKDNNEPKSQFSDPCAIPSDGQLWSFLNDPVENNSSPGKAGVTNMNEDHDVVKILPPDRKISMFSAEIWTEEILPNKKFVYPEPELVEIFENKMLNQFKNFEDYGTESFDLSSTWADNNLGKSNFINSALLTTKSKTSLPAQKIINFDDEIWPVCPKLIPSDKELSQSILDNKYDSISPEKLNENDEDVNSLAHLRFIEPTHEIEHQKTGSTYSTEKIRRSNQENRIFCEKNLIKNIIGKTPNENLRNGDSKPEPLIEPETEQQLKEFIRCEKEVQKYLIIDDESCATQNSKKKLPSMCDSESVNAVIEDVLNRIENKMSSTNCNEKTSANDLKLKQSKENSFTSFGAQKSVEQISLPLVKDDGIVRTLFEKNLSTLTDSCAISRDVDNISQSLTISSGDKMCKTSTEPVVSRLSEMELRCVENRSEKQESNKKRKVVRFKTCIELDNVREKSENLEERDVRQSGNELRLSFDNVNDTLNSLNVKQLEQEFFQLNYQILRQVETDPLVYDVVESLTKVEKMINKNRQLEERLQQLQPNVTASWITPLNAEKLLAKALIRCRNYLQNNGYNREVTYTINNLLSNAVDRLKQSVERQMLILTAQEKRCSTSAGRRRSSKSSHRENLSTTKEALIANEIGANRVKCLISDILMLTEKLLPTYKGKDIQKKTLDTTNLRQYDTKSYPKNDRIRSEPVRSEIPMLISESVLNSREDQNQRDMQSRGHHKEDKEFETLHMRISGPAHPKKSARTESSKALKKIFNDTWENRSKTLPRFCNANDSTNNFRLLNAPHSTSVSQKLPVWKPGGTNFVQSSINIIPNNQKIRQPPSSSFNKKKNTTSERNRDIKSQPRAKLAPSTAKNQSKVIEKSIIKPHNTTSDAKIRKTPIKEQQSEVVCLGKKKIEALAEVGEVRARKPRSKSRTRTRTPTEILRTAVTEIPLEYAKDNWPKNEQKSPIVQAVPLAKKTSSSPKDIIHMLEELIKSSNQETSIQKAPSVQVVARCNVAVKEVKKEFASSKVELEAGLSPSKEQDHRDPERSLKYSEETMKASKIVDEISTVEEQSSRLNSLPDSDIQRKESKISSHPNSVEILAISKPNSEVSVNQFTEERTSSSSNLGCSAELSSGHSIVSSKCCQASLTSDTVVTSCCEETPKESNESFEIAKHDEEEQNVSMDNDTGSKKKFVNRHAKSLEMLKEILSDQGLGIHFLNKAENELRARCKCNSGRRGLTAKRSLGTNFGNSKISSEIISEISLPDKNISSTILGKLATLSEADSDVKLAEVATMTSEKNSAVSANDKSRSDKFQLHCNREDKILSTEVDTVENATQLDVPLKLDMGVGDEPVVDILVTTDEKNQDNFTPSSSSFTRDELVANKNELLENKLPDSILKAFELAWIRAKNLYEAINILKQHKSSFQSHPSVAAENLFHANHMLSDNVEKMNEPAKNSTSVSSVKIITPKIGIKLNDEVNSSKTIKFGAEKLQARKIIARNKINLMESREKIGDDKFQKLDNVDKITRSKLPVIPKPSTVKRKANGASIDKITAVKQQNIDPKQDIFLKNKFDSYTKSPQKTTAEKKNQQDFVVGCMNDKRIETLHFAGRRNSSNFETGITDINSEEKFLNVDSSNYETPKTTKKIQDSFPGSRIKTLLKENLEHFQINCNSLDDEIVLKDFREENVTASSDDETSTNKVFIETTTSTSCTHLADCKILPEVKSVVNFLLNDVSKRWESSTMTELRNIQTHLPGIRRLKKPVRRIKSERNKKVMKFEKRSIFSGKYLNTLSDIIISREHLLSLIYVAICSFVFFCLQFSVYCEV